MQTMHRTARVVRARTGCGCCKLCPSRWVRSRPRDRACMLPLRRGGLGLRTQSDELLETASVACAGHAGSNLEPVSSGALPSTFEQGRVRACLRPWWSSLCVRYAEQFGRGASAKVLPAEVLQTSPGAWGIRKGAFVCWGMRLLPVGAEGEFSYVRQIQSGLLTSREQAMRYDAGSAVLALVS